MPDVIECAGHPRNMGLDQGRGCRAGVRERVGRSGRVGERSRIASLRPFASGAVLGSGAGREIVRHFPHLTERIDGLARSAGVPLDSLMELHVSAQDGKRGEEPVTSDAASLLAVGMAELEGVILQRSLPAVEPPESGWIVRRSRPEVGFDSLEVTLPWLVSAVTGVNETGLCASLVGRAGVDGAPAGARVVPPSLLLVQECLQRFRDVEASLDWCLSRPVSGPATLLLADEKAQIAAVEIGEDERRVLRPEDGLLLAGASQRRLDALREQVLRDRVVHPELLAAAGRPAPDSGPAPFACVRIDPSRRLLELRSLTGKRVEIALEV